MSSHSLKLFDLRGHVALITGAGRGLGLEAARVLADAGATVILNGRDRIALEVAAASIMQNGGSVEVAPFDITNADQVDAGLQLLLDRHGIINILINNAGPRDRRSIMDLPVADFSALLSAHIVASYRLAKWVIPGMVERKAGRIINLSSVAAIVGNRGDAGYGASKAGVAGLTRTMAAELGAYGITVNAIAPGAFGTESNLVAFAEPKIADLIASRTMLGRYGQPSEIAGPILLLAAAAGSYITGQVLVVDGGMTTMM